MSVDSRGVAPGSDSGSEPDVNSDSDLDSDSELGPAWSRNFPARIRDVAQEWPTFTLQCIG